MSDFNPVRAAKPLINIILDLETLSTREDAAIIQIGAVVTSESCFKLPDGIPIEFEQTIRYEDCIAGEFHVENVTMEWWEKQDRQTRAQVFSGQDSYESAFGEFSDWIKAIEAEGFDVAIWGNGSDFDNRLLNYSLSSFGFTNVWKYWNNRCLRTLIALADIEKPPRIPEYERQHTALGDARYEERLYTLAMRKLQNVP